MLTLTQIGTGLIALGFGMTSFSLALPDSTPGSPQTIVLKLGGAFVLVGVYLGGRKPSETPA